MRNAVQWGLMLATAVVGLGSVAGCSSTDVAGADAPPPPITLPIEPTAKEDRVEYAGPPMTSPASPPPPPAPSASMVVTGERAVTSSPTIVPPGRSQRAPQSGILTAGDYDDLLNPAQYAAYVARQLQEPGSRNLPYVDTARAVTVRVTDSRDRPMPFVPVSARKSDGATLTLRTVADGSVTFFPALDGLGDSSRVTIGSGAAAVTRTLTPGQDRTLDVRLPGQAQTVRAFDLLLVIDATGSMDDEMNYLKSELTAIMGALAERHPGVDTRIGLIVYRDVGDDYVVRQFPFTSDVAALQAHLARQQAGGGGDYPEAVDQAMAAAIAYPWREDAVKALMLVADAPPHDNKVAATWSSALQARADRIQIVPVAASGVADEAEFVMRAMAAATQSRYLFLTDDSGVGLPHDTPEVKCYAVTRLDGLVRRVLDGLISGRRIEPSDDEVIRKVGPYDRGVCDVGRPKPY